LLGISIISFKNGYFIFVVASSPLARHFFAHRLDAHAIVLAEAREIANGAAEDDDLGTSDIMVSEVIRTGELEVWFLSQHLR
jgi:DNA-binding ferritin-like protein